MAYDRYDSRDSERGYRDDRQRSSGERDDRGFFERARDEVNSWFGDEESGGRRDADDRMSHPGSSRGYETRSDQQRRGYDEHGSNRGSAPRAQDEEEGRQRPGREDSRFGHSDRGAMFGGGQSTSFGRGRDEGDYRNQYGRGGGESGGFGRSDYGRQSQRDPDRDHQSRGLQSQGSERQRPLTGDYARGSDQQRRSASGLGGQESGRERYGRQDFSQDQSRDRSHTYGGWGDQNSQRQDRGSDYARSGMMGAAGGASSFGRSAHDDHYSSWRQRQIEELDRDYDEYRREHQSRFENEFSGFRQQRQTKRQMMQSIREHFEVVDESGQHIGTVDKVRGEKVIMTKNDPEAGGIHRSFTCSLLERVEDNKVYLTGAKDTIRSRLTEEQEDDRNRERSSGGGILGSLFGSGEEDRSEQLRREQEKKEHQGEGPHMLDQSFSGTYEDDDKPKK